MPPLVFTNNLHLWIPGFATMFVQLEISWCRDWGKPQVQKRQMINRKHRRRSSPLLANPERHGIVHIVFEHTELCHPTRHRLVLLCHRHRNSSARWWWLTSGDGIPKASIGGRRGSLIGILQNTARYSECWFSESAFYGHIRSRIAQHYERILGESGSLTAPRGNSLYYLLRLVHSWIATHLKSHILRGVDHWFPPPFEISSFSI